MPPRTCSMPVAAIRTCRKPQPNCCTYMSGAKSSYESIDVNLIDDRDRREHAELATCWTDDFVGVNLNFRDNASVSDSRRRALFITPSIVASSSMVLVGPASRHLTQRPLSIRVWMEAKMALESSRDQLYASLTETTGLAYLCSNVNDQAFSKGRSSLATLAISQHDQPGTNWIERDCSYTRRDASFSWKRVASSYVSLPMVSSVASSSGRAGLSAVTISWSQV